MSGHPEWKIGDVTVTMVVERRTEMPIDFIPGATEAALTPHRRWLQPWAYSAEGLLRFVIQALCLTVGDQRIVVDTCVGPRRLPDVYAWVANDGTFISTLDEVGFGRDDVDYVICTHLHFDHVGWNTMLENGEWVPTFRRARYVIPWKEYDHWQSTPEDQQASANVFNFNDAVTPLLAHDRVDFVEPGHRINEALELVSTPGHSPGHVSVLITSNGEAALITGDCAHHPLQLAEPEWHSLADFDPQQSSATRRSIIDQYVDTEVLLIGTHFPPPSAGYLVTEEGNVRFRPVENGAHP